MSDTMAPEAAPAEAEAGKKGKKAKKDKGEKGAKGKSNLVPAIILAAGIAAGGYFMGGSGEGAASTAPTTTEAPKGGEYLTIEPMSLNLAGGHYARIGMSLQLVEGVAAKEFEKAGKPAALKDRLISQVSGKPIEELSNAEGQNRLKAELTAAAKELFEEEAVGVVFTEFVTQ